jgi:two-component system, cell cycle response regulator
MNDDNDDQHSGDTTELYAGDIARKRRAMERRVPTLTALAGSQAGNTMRLSEQAFSIGRDRSCELFCSDSGVSRIHATIEQNSSGQFVIRDRESTNGTFVNGHRIRESTLADGDTIHLGPIAVVHLSHITEAEFELRRQQYEESIRDPLTGLYNRRFLLMSLQSDIAHSVRFRDELSFVLFDIDRFKHVNDTFGHPAGDTVLRKLAVAIANQLRQEDLFARYGGEEFAVILRGLDGPQAVAFCERVRSLVSKIPMTDDEPELKITISLGVAAFDLQSDQRPEDLIALADKRLYEAKQSGRNRTMGP